VIRVTTRRDSLAGVDCLQLEVFDSGRGMTAEMQARVFDPFFTTKLAGHGLGLAVVQGIVRSLGGVIRLVSAPGKGTTFQILLPCAEQTAEPTRSTTSRVGEETVQFRKPTILFVEDEDLLRLATSKMLRKNGFSVIEAADGSVALDLIRAHKDDIDVLFLDITLPGASSREVLEEAMRQKPQMITIATSAYNEGMAATALAGSVEHFIRKPYGLGDLMDMIRKILSS